MNKYITLLKLSWQNGLVYRTSVILWRIRQFLGTLMSLTVWIVIFTGNSQAFNYSQESMVAYIFLVSFLQSLIISSALNGLAERVYSGELSNHLLKPINIFGYFAVEEIADKGKNLFFLLLETLILLLVFKPMFTFPELETLTLFFLWTLFGVIINFLITLLFGSFGFWSPDTWGPRFLFFMILNFTAGKLFPLDILPKFIQNILYFTPFPYLSFIQIQLFLERLSEKEIITQTFLFLFWIAILVVLNRKLWNKGLKSYESAGR